MVLRGLVVLAPLLACTPKGVGVSAAGQAPSPVALAQPRLQLAAGLQHTCAAAAGQVLCWGYNGHGELGDGTRDDRRAPAPVPGVSDTAAVVAGHWHACALRSDGTVRCWGDASRGQVGDGETGTRLMAVVVPGLTQVAAISAAGTGTCALRSGGEVWCWGDRHGDVDDERGSLRPREIAAARGATAIAAGSGYGCAVVDRRVRCWGQAPLPDGVTAEDAAVEVPGVGEVVEVAAGARHACARTVDGGVRCWGEGRDGQRGDGVLDAMPTRWHGPHPPPFKRAAHGVVAVVGLDAVVRLAANDDHSCALRRGGELRCWGAGRDGQLGDGGDAAQPRPVTVPIAGVVDMALGSAHACAVLEDGSGRCWGYNDAGQADNAAPVRRGAPDPTFGHAGSGDAPGRKDMLAISSLATSGRHACVVRGGAVECVGDNGFGQLGDGTRVNRAAPVRVAGLGDAQEVIAGARHSCARRAGGEVMCWGDDTFGQLGQPGAPVGEPRDEHGMSPPPPPIETRGRTTPVAVVGLVGARRLAVREHYTCALQDAGVLRCWHGEGAAALAEPLQLPPDTVEVGLGAVHGCARGSGGEVRCWGLNFYGRVGDGTRIDRPQPTPVTGLGDAIGLAVGRLHSCALRGDGAVFCWGSGSGGLLGDGDEEDRATIVAVEGLHEATAVVAGEDHSCALRADGGVVCWGSNLEGALGDGTTSTRLVPVAVAGLRRATALAAGAQHSCARVATSERVLCWGRDLRDPDRPRGWDTVRTPAAISGLPGR